MIYRYLNVLFVMTNKGNYLVVPPRWIYEPQDSSVISGKNVIIDCQADGLPKPSITWKKAIGD